MWAVIRSVKNFITAILLPSKLSIHLLDHLYRDIVSQECQNNCTHLLVMQTSKFQTWMESNLLMAGMCVWILNQSVH